jgi:tetratricopeptide (TPR) repeat protein
MTTKAGTSTKLKLSNSTSPLGSSRTNSRPNTGRESGVKDPRASGKLSSSKGLSASVACNSKLSGKLSTLAESSGHNSSCHPVVGATVRPVTTAGELRCKTKSADVLKDTLGARKPSAALANISQQRLTTLMAVAAANEDARKEIKAEKEASRQLAKLTKSTAHDLHFTLLGNMDSLLHRQLNQGERDLLVEGIRIEGEEDLDRAHVFYSRAGMHSHEPHLSKIFLGSLFYKKKNYLSAIKYFSSAILLLDELRGHSENYDNDSFRTHYNRGVTKINCGDDEEGVKDLEFAVNIKPDNAVARETYAIALRRIGKFDAAITNTLKFKEAQQNAANEARNQAFLDEAANQAANVAGGHGSSSANLLMGQLSFNGDEAGTNIFPQKSGLGAMTSISENGEGATSSSLIPGHFGPLNTTNLMTGSPAHPAPSMFIKREASNAKFTQFAPTM